MKISGEKMFFGQSHPLKHNHFKIQLIEIIIKKLSLKLKFYSIHEIELPKLVYKPVGFASKIFNGRDGFFCNENILSKKRNFYSNY